MKLLRSKMQSVLFNKEIYEKLPLSVLDVGLGGYGSDLDPITRPKT